MPVSASTGRANVTAATTAKVRQTRVIDPKECVRESKTRWINTVSPSRRPPCPEEPPQAASRRGGLLRMRNFVNAIDGISHAEERSKSASPSSRDRDAALRKIPSHAQTRERSRRRDHPPPRRFWSPGFELDFSRSRTLGFGKNKVQNAVFQRGLDAIPVDVFRQGEYPLVIAVGIFVINPLVAGMLIGRAPSANCQHPPLEGDVHPIERDTRHLGEHDDVIASFVDVGGRQEYRPRRCALTALDRLRYLLIDSSHFLGHDCTPSIKVIQRGSRSSSAGPPPAVAARFPGCHCRSVPGPCPDRPGTAVEPHEKTCRKRARAAANWRPAPAWGVLLPRGSARLPAG